MNQLPLTTWNIFLRDGAQIGFFAFLVLDVDLDLREAVGEGVGGRGRGRGGVLLVIEDAADLPLVLVPLHGAVLQLEEEGSTSFSQFLWILDLI